MGTADKVSIALMGAFLIGAPIGIVYSWYYVLKRPLASKRSWRDHASASALVVITVAAVTSFPTFMYLRTEYSLANGNDWRVYDALARVLRPVVWTAAGAAVLSILGTPRLIAPLLVAAFGTIIWWVMPLLLQ